MSLSPSQFSDKDRTLPGMPLPMAERPAGPTATPFKPTSRNRKWSGIAPGQQIMGVRDLGSTHEADPHGFAHEGRMQNFADWPTQGGSGQSARNFYKTVGGKHSKNPSVVMHWAAQPLHDVPSDAIVHTAQHWEHETESGSNAMTQEGRKRIDAIRADLENGGTINKPAWLVRHNERLYALDGHHRIVAAREAGHPTFPARIWDTGTSTK